MKLLKNYQNLIMLSFVKFIDDEVIQVASLRGKVRRAFQIYSPMIIWRIPVTQIRAGLNVFLSSGIFS